MNYKASQAYLLSKPEAIEDYPFGEDVAVFKIKNKMFATLAYHESIAQMNLKCEPQEALMLRDVFEAVIPGYHMNKKHWNTIILNGSIPESEIKRMIDRSYSLVVNGLKKSEKDALVLIHGKDVIHKK
ncbi:MmcQ/YjbR family DNA-binding protein [Pleionea sp. CnH1-48]|uniref:MmcQ/YjbR family DNA-binding protein n=1 Tax=Pleionea sp. CnH1-48 TaxID=2954494 RepID=UPI00209757F4|nr:MmcQ/YjbR family DNA-binding protein [Pleionea sp. CnH1-48]MCO7226703.1 MmcQ/YjbR family DNA-binding protein [Pleionea sp. CnH1-48]